MAGDEEWSGGAVRWWWWCGGGGGGGGGGGSGGEGGAAGGWRGDLGADELAHEVDRRGHRLGCAVAQHRHRRGARLAPIEGAARLHARPPRVDKLAQDAELQGAVAQRVQPHAERLHGAHRALAQLAGRLWVHPPLHVVPP
eukprot:scaffold17726_cov69-Phaeocystis_antarctica.AAC.2